MLNKLKSKAGMTLMEVMVSLLIMVLLVVGMGTGMDAGMRVYADAHFESSSASLAGIINTSLSDVLRYAQNINDPTTGNAVESTTSSFVFTNLEYGLRDAKFVLPNTEGAEGVIQIVTPSSTKAYALVNSGAYPDLKVIDFTITFYPESATGSLLTQDGSSTTINRGGFFYVEYKIANTDSSKTRDAETVVRLMNG